MARNTMAMHELAEKGHVFRTPEPTALAGKPIIQQTIKLQLRVGIEPPLVVHYTAHDEQPLFLVKALRPPPRQGF